MATLKFVLNKTRQYSNNEYPIFIRINHKNQRRLVSVKKSISADFWDDKNGLVITDSKDKTVKNYLKILNAQLQERLSKLKLDLIGLETRNPHLSIDDIVNLFEPVRKHASLFTFTQSLITRLENAGKMGNARAYKSFLSVFKKFRKEKDLSFDELSYKVLISFEEHLQGKGRTVNAISFHMRTLRSVYNKAIKEGLAHQELYPFKDYQVKREKTSKRAIIKGDISLIKELDLSDLPDLDKARDYFLFSFFTRGMAFVDIAYLKVKNIVGDRLIYSRSKTNQKFTIKLTQQSFSIIRKYNDLTDRESYIFPIIINPDGDRYTQYRNGMRLTNKKLKKIGEMIGLEVPLTTYVSRHSWATIAKRSGIPTAIISEGLGHETERTTQIYLDSFENQVLDDANDLITNI